MAAASPRPRNLKLVEGARPGRDSGGRKVPQTPGFIRLPPEAPEWLSEPARAQWDLVVPELQRLQLTKPIDAASLTAYCLAWDRLVTAQGLIAAEGLLAENSQGRVRHPAVAIVEAASKELRAWAVEFGLTPSAEQRVGKPEASNGAEEDPYS